MIGPVVIAVFVGAAVTFLVEPSSVLRGYLWYAGVASAVFVVVSWLQAQSVQVQQQRQK